MPRRASLAIFALLALQLLWPLSYYTLRSDRRDERFAWRMFSPVRVERCHTSFKQAEGDAPVNAKRHFHPAWLSLAARGRISVIEAMGERLCEIYPEKGIEIRVACETSPGSAGPRGRKLLDTRLGSSTVDVELISAGVFDFCNVGRL